MNGNFSMIGTIKKRKLNWQHPYRINGRNKTMKNTHKQLTTKSLKPTQGSISKMRYNEQFIDALTELADIMSRKGEPFRAKAYKSAAITIMNCSCDITEPDQLKDAKHVGNAVLTKLHELCKTGTIKIIEEERKDPVNQLTRVYGIGPKKANELVANGVTSIEDLRNKQDLLSDNMILGLKYFDDIETRIPRSEVDEYKSILTKIFENCAPPGSTFEIVGSYRRGNSSSGDIDIIITNANNNRTVYEKFLDALIANGTLVEILSRGKTKSMTIARLGSQDTVQRRARRLDFLYAPPSEYAFALLYFTGSKSFNTVQRQRALDRGYSLNEHGFYKMDGRKKSATKLDKSFPSEASIFEFLQMDYRAPNERIDARSVCETKQSSNSNNNISTLLTAFRKKGITVLDELSENQLNLMIRKANEVYHDNTGEIPPLFTDAEYDILCETTAKRFPTNQVVTEGHTNTNIDIVKNKATLPFEMWSMDKIKPDTHALEKWKSTYKGPYVLSCKLDGVSGLYVSGNADDKSPRLYTRGNGLVGQDVSHLIPYLALPTKSGLVLRGEFVISKSTFDAKYASTFANPRNFVAGVVNQKKVEVEKFVDIDFVCYEVIRPVMKPSEQMAMLTNMGVIAVQHTMPPVDSESLTNELLSEMLQKSRDDYTYEIDGIICCDDNIYPRSNGNPAHAFAFKMMLSDQIAEAKVLEIIWSPSKDGFLKPRVHIEPVVLGGAHIEYATGFNAKFVNDNRIGAGAVVRIIRSGDVIPHIVAVVEPALQPGLPTVPYDWNSTGVDIVLHNPENDPIVREKTIAGFFRNVGVDGLSIGNTRRIINAGFDTIPKIIHMNRDDFLGIDGFKERLADKLHTGIKSKLNDATIAELMHATNIFGRGFGVKRLQAIISAEPDILRKELSNKMIVDKLESIPGMASKTSVQFANHIPEFVTWIKDAGLETKLDATVTNVKQDNPMYGKKYVITGFRDKELVDHLATLGAINTSSVSKNTDFVIVKNDKQNTGKANEARALGIKIVTKSEVYDK